MQEHPDSVATQHGIHVTARTIIPSPNDALLCRSSLERFPHLWGPNPRTFSAPIPNHSYRRCGHGHARHAARRRSAGNARVARGARFGAERDGPERAHFLLEQLIDQARRSGAYLPFNANTAYVNTIPLGAGGALPGRRASSSTASARSSAGTRWRWWCAPTRSHPSCGGHIASYASAATLYEVGFNHFLRAPSDDHGGDLVYFQGHSARRASTRAPSSRAGSARSSCDNFRQEVGGKGLSSYPHPVADAGLLAVPDRLDGPRADHGDLPGALHALPAGPRPRRHRRAARSGRSSATARWTSPSRWARSRSPAREKLDNLIFVINCNLQRLDGPVRGNGKIIQELEGASAAPAGT